MYQDYIYNTCTQSSAVSAESPKNIQFVKHLLKCRKNSLAAIFFRITGFSFKSRFVKGNKEEHTLGALQVFWN